MGSEEESGKDWSELEEEAAQGKVEIFKIKIALESQFQLQVVDVLGS